MKKLFILFILIIIVISGCKQQKDNCAEILYDEMLRYAELVPKDMKVSEAIEIATNERNRIKTLKYLDLAIKLNC